MQKCKFIMNTLRITQGYGGNYSHKDSYAIDLGGADCNKDYAYAPCDVVVKRIYGTYNAVWFESLDAVLCADGKERKLVFLLLHINKADLNALGIKVGKVFKQGEHFYREGTAGNATGNHIHLEVGEAPFKPTGWYKTSVKDNTGNYIWKINNQLKPHEIFYLPKDTVIQNDGGYDWTTEVETTMNKKVETYKILDVSKYQPTIDYAKTAKVIDGVILRIGLTYWGKQNMGKDECFEKHYAGFKAQGVPVGVYYYSCADTVAIAEKEADYCLSLLKGKQFEFPIYYDVENNERQGKLSKAQLTRIVDAFCSKVEKAGYFVGFYASTSWLTGKMDTPYLSEKYTLWKADYRSDYDKTIECDMHQYTSEGNVDGITKDDGKLAPVDLSTCERYFPTEIKNAGLNGFKKATTITPTPKPVTKPVTKSVDELAQEVLNGKWGTGVERKTALTKAGYDYAAVQKRVNEILHEQKIEKVAKEVLAGKWGNGLVRKRKLTLAGYNYKEVQDAVNKLL